MLSQTRTAAHGNGARYAFGVLTLFIIMHSKTSDYSVLVRVCVRVGLSECVCVCWMGQTALEIGRAHV